MNKLKLTPEEIICLQWSGLDNHKILRADSVYFNQVFSQQEYEFEFYLNKAKRLMEGQREFGIRTISWWDETYPKSLRAIGSEAPPLIHLLGNVDLLTEEHTVAVIGARAADSMGIHIAYNLGMRYAEQGEIVISGLALGCDAAAHEGCLNVSGKTIAVVASGLNITHPKEHRELQQRILNSDGLLLSEQLLSVKANPTKLIARNRLQAALSQSVILVQCPKESGSMKTMDFARRYNKACYAVAFEHPSHVNGGNRYLIDEGLADPL